jgi:hypothetical protein
MLSEALAEALRAAKPAKEFTWDDLDPWDHLARWERAELFAARDAGDEERMAVLIRRGERRGKWKSALFDGVTWDEGITSPPDEYTRCLMGDALRNGCECVLEVLDGEEEFEPNGVRLPGQRYSGFHHACWDVHLARQRALAPPEPEPEQEPEVAVSVVEPVDLEPVEAEPEVVSEPDEETPEPAEPSRSVARPAPEWLVNRQLGELSSRAGLGVYDGVEAARAAGLLPDDRR